ncbi:hypothetical protein GCM10022243_42870 [Saccharothrix violaceirubra]|uniref:Uncharacterized protein n=1 Tax=Saccharothrix violaceirubra TaxID=413306 RepID=A0A7W7T2U3_9PSEU|nr:hypothetical protein [Saccharothrix violaceirubra]MBB4965575.1 hypothetical protein [Saccharothrix violaceirubra]
MRPLLISALVAAAVLVPVSSASAADYTVHRSAIGSGTARGFTAAVELAAESAHRAVLAEGGDCVGWQHELLRLEEHPHTLLVFATIKASAVCVR